MTAGKELTTIDATAEVIETKRVDLPAKIAGGLQSIEDKLLMEAVGILQDVQCFSDIDPGTDKPPQEWIDELGPARAKKRLRLAQAGWMSSKEAPIGIKVSQDIATNIMKAKSQRVVGNTLNVTVEKAVFIEGSQPKLYPETEVDSDEE